MRMSKYSRLQVINTMNENGMVPLFFHNDFDVANAILDACYNGGSRLLEFTSRGDFAHEVFGPLVKYASEKLPGMIIGVGSITDASQASLYMNLGANFVVTPVFRKDIAITCNRRKVLWSPGCGSLTEIARAEELGCEIVKLFPGGTYGPSFIKAIKGPQPWTNVMPTGGVSPDEENLKSWFDSGAFCVGMGSKLISKEIIKKRNYSKLKNDVQNVLKVIKKIKST